MDVTLFKLMTEVKIDRLRAGRLNICREREPWFSPGDCEEPWPRPGRSPLPGHHDMKPLPECTFMCWS